MTSKKFLLFSKLRAEKSGEDTDSTWPNQKPFTENRRINEFSKEKGEQTIAQMVAKRGTGKRKYACHSFTHTVSRAQPKKGKKC